jgi:hypothetical protein
LAKVVALCEFVAGRRAALRALFVRSDDSLLVTLADVDYEFQGQQVRSRHHVPAAAISQAADKMFDLFKMQ